MPSKTSFFNRTIFLNNVRRFWPIWGAYLGVWILIQPLPLLNNYVNSPLYTCRSVLNMGLYGGIIVCAIFAVFAAMAVWSFLYNARSAHGITCLPVRRETLFVTSVLSGLLPLLAANVIIMLLTLLCSRGWLPVVNGLEWFAMVSLILFFFYAFATLCAQLTGHILILPAVYGILNFVAVGVETLLKNVFAPFVYGMFSSGGYVTRYFSPPMGLWTGMRVDSITEPDLLADTYRTVGYHYAGWSALLVYAVVGLVFLALALWLYRRRQIETAGDVVAVKQLKPVFRWCMALGCGLVLASIADFVLYDRGYLMSNAGHIAFVLTIFLLLGALIGWFGSEMLMRKSFRVFTRNRVAGYGICAVIIAAVMLGMRFDLFGYERRVPNPENVKSVTLSAIGAPLTLEDEESIRSVTELHRRIIADKSWNMQAGSNPAELDWTSFYLHYTLQNGATLSRRYALVYLNDDPTAKGELGELQAIINSPAAIETRKKTSFPYTRENMQSGEVSAAMTATECAEAGNWNSPEEYVLMEVCNFSRAEVAAMDMEMRLFTVADAFLTRSANQEFIYEYYGVPTMEYDLALNAIQSQGPDYDIAYFQYTFFFQPDEMYDLYTTCILPDMTDGTIGKLWVVTDREYFDTVYNARIDIEAREYRPGQGMASASNLVPSTEAYEYDHFYTVPTVDARRTNAWLAEHGVHLHTYTDIGELVYFQ